MPIEEFFERGDRKGPDGAGSLLGRTLRAINVYAHGLLLAPGIDEPITPLTRAECANTFGDLALSAPDGDTLAGKAAATASVLAGLNSTQTQQMCEPLVPQQQLRICYSRHGEYSSSDPLAAFLRLAANTVEVMPPLSGIAPGAVNGAEAAIVASPRSGADLEIFEQDLSRIRRLTSVNSIRVLYLSGLNKTPAAGIAGITVCRLPVDIERLGNFMKQTGEASTTRITAKAA